MMHKQGTIGRAELWDVDFPGQIPPSPVNYRTVPVDGIELEGHRLIAVEVGHTDTDDTTVLHVPSIGLVVAGDVVYNGVHQYLLESADGGVDSWLVALDKVASLQPSAVVAGHKNKDLPDDPATIEQTRDYLLNAQRLFAETPNPRDYFDCMVALYPDRLNVGPVWYTAVVLLPEQTIEDEVTNWFFNDYLATWIGVGAGTIDRGPEFILDYWSAPLNSSDDQGSQWILDGQAVVAQLDALQTRLRAERYGNTTVPDFRVRAYHDNGAAIEVIWSRRRTDGSEIERLAAHFEVARGLEGWRIISIQAKPTTGDSLNAVWPQAN